MKMDMRAGSMTDCCTLQCGALQSCAPQCSAISSSLCSVAVQRNAISVHSSNSIAGSGGAGQHQIMMTSKYVDIPESHSTYGYVHCFFQSYSHTTCRGIEIPFIGLTDFVQGTWNNIQQF